MTVVSVKNLSKNYPSFRLDNVSFSLEKGRIYGFIGRNGAGKSTTVKAMLNLIHPDGGEVCYFGLPLTGNEAEIKNRTGYSTGTVNYYPRKKIREIASVTKIFYDRWDDASYKKYLELFSLDEEKTPFQLSEGMKVKWNLALALSHGAEILILDEPTSGLDPFSRNELLKLFEKLRDDGITVFFSTHIISDIEKCADGIIYISKGKIIAEKSKADFIRDLSLPGETLEQTFLRLEEKC